MERRQRRDASLGEKEKRDGWRDEKVPRVGPTMVSGPFFERFAGAADLQVSRL